MPSRDRGRSHEPRVLQTIAEALNGANDVDQALHATLEQVCLALPL
jgi:hypothetical protein